MPFEFLIAGVLGLVIGSFLNVCIYRVPLGKSIVSPPSTCPGCNFQIKPWHNIPVLSYIFLRGRCAYCGTRISPRYPAVELLNMFAYLAAVYRFGPTAGCAVVMALLSAFIVISFIDYDHHIIPDEISLPGIVIGLLAGPLVLKIGWLNSILGVLVGGGGLALVGYAGDLIFKKESLGGGDVKLMAMVGAFLGWKMVLLTVFLGSFFGSVVGLSLMAFKRLGRGEHIPFGPFLLAGATVAMFAGHGMLAWYGGLGR